MKEHIFSYMSPDDWINTAQVSNEWLELTLGSITKIELCHRQALDDLAEFMNQEWETENTWISTLLLMPKLQHLECFENSYAFWNEISPICNRLKVLNFHPVNTEPFDLDNLKITFESLSELKWHGGYQDAPFPLKMFQVAPKLEKLTLIDVYMTREWEKKIPENVKHILLDWVDFSDDSHCSARFLCENPSTLETFSVENMHRSVSPDFDITPSLKNLELGINYGGVSTSVAVYNALTNCPNLESVKVCGVTITHSWRKAIPKKVKSISFRAMTVEENIRGDFSFDWLFQNYDGLDSLEVEQRSWTQFHLKKFYPTKNLKKLSVYNCGETVNPLDTNEPVDPFSDICTHMVRGSYLVDVTLRKPVIDMSWRHIFPPTVKKLKLEDFRLTKLASEIFSPQFICENPPNIELFSVEYTYDGQLPAMDSSAFSGMNKLKKVYLLYEPISGDCLQSILTHCSALTLIVFQNLEDNALGNIPQHLRLSNVRELSVQNPVNKSRLLWRLFPNMKCLS